MGLIDGGDLRIVALDAGDVADAVKLSTEAGWNQVAADWAMMLKIGKGFGIRDEGRLVASGLALSHPPDFGWVSMVLVTETHRRLGLAKALLQHLIAHLEALGLTPMLDATPQGRAIYLPLGFHDIEPISRWRRPGRPVRLLPEQAPIDLDHVKRSDRMAFGADRSAILTDLASRPRAFARIGAKGAFLLSRAGRTATQIGPIVAQTVQEAVALVDEAIAGIAGPVLIDVPDRETALREDLKHQGFTVERSFIRMALGRGEAFGEPYRMRAIAGPELG